MSEEAKKRNVFGCAPRRIKVSRTIKKTKAPGYEYWGRRPIARNHGAIPGRLTKNWTHRLERLEGKKAIKDGLKED